MNKEDEILEALNEIKAHLGIGLPWLYRNQMMDGLGLREENCIKCGLDLNGVMGYVCSNKDYPCGLGGATCTV